MADARNAECVNCARPLRFRPPALLAGGGLMMQGEQLCGSRIALLELHRGAGIRPRMMPRKKRTKARSSPGTELSPGKLDPARLEGVEELLSKRPLIPGEDPTLYDALFGEGPGGRAPIRYHRAHLGEGYRGPRLGNAALASTARRDSSPSSSRGAARSTERPSRRPAKARVWRTRLAAS